MYESDFWTRSAEAMEQSLEGNRLIAREIADLTRSLWHRLMLSLDKVIHGQSQHRHLPPV